MKKRNKQCCFRSRCRYTILIEQGQNNLKSFCHDRDSKVELCGKETDDMLDYMLPISMSPSFDFNKCKPSARVDFRSFIPKTMISRIIDYNVMIIFFFLSLTRMNYVIKG